MADVTEAFLRGQAAGQAVLEHRQALDENKLRSMVLKHQLASLKLEDALRNRDIALQHASLLEGRPANEIPQEPAPGFGNLPANGYVANIGDQTTQPAPTQSAAIPIPGVDVPELGVHDSGFNVRPRSMEDIVRAQIFQRLREPVKLGQGETLSVPLTGDVLARGGAKPLVVGRGATAIDPSTGATIATGQPVPEPTVTVHTMENGKPVTKVLPRSQASGQTFTAPPPASVIVNNSMQGDVDALVEGIANGSQPPDQLPRTALGVKVRAGLERQGFDLTKATQDYKATQRYLATLNGPQQLRLRQAVAFTTESLQPIRDLAEEWSRARILKDGKLVPLNKLELTAAANGAYGDKAASIATRLLGQINDVVSELATVYKGGNASTDEGLRLAASNLQGSWSKKVLLDNIDQVERNLQYRNNSIKLTGAITTDGAVAPGGGRGGATPDLTGLQPGHGRTFTDGPFKGQTWTIGADGTPQQVTPQGGR